MEECARKNCVWDQSRPSVEELKKGGGVHVFVVNLRIYVHPGKSYF
jgi:hypothetical protein